MLRPGGVLVVSVPAPRPARTGSTRSTCTRRAAAPPAALAAARAGDGVRRAAAPPLHRRASSRSCWARRSPSTASRAPGSGCRSSSTSACSSSRVPAAARARRARARAVAPARLHASTTCVPLGPLGYHLDGARPADATGRRAVSARVLFACWPFEGHVFPQLSVALALRERGARGRLLHRPAAASRRSRREGIECFPFDRVQGSWQRVHERERARAAGAAVAAAPARGVPRVAGRDRSRTRSPTCATVMDALAARRDRRRRLDVGPEPDPARGRPIPVALAVDADLRRSSPGRDAPPLGSRARRRRARADRALRAGRRARRRRPARARRPAGGSTRCAPTTAWPPLGCSVNASLRAAAALPRRQRPGARLRPARPAAERALRRPAAVASARAAGDARVARPRCRPTARGCTSPRAPRTTRSRSCCGPPRAGSPAPAFEAILTTGRKRDPTALGRPARPTSTSRDWLSHGELLPRCAALVTTGGAGTMIVGALAAGVPLVDGARPRWDKPDNARRIVEAGVARAAVAAALHAGRPARGRRRGARRPEPTAQRAAVAGGWPPRPGPPARRAASRRLAADPAAGSSRRGGSRPPAGAGRT